MSVVALSCVTEQHEGYRELGRGHALSEAAVDSQRTPEGHSKDDTHHDSQSQEEAAPRRATDSDGIQRRHKGSAPRRELSSRPPLDAKRQEGKEDVEDQAEQEVLPRIRNPGDPPCSRRLACNPLDRNLS